MCMRVCISKHIFKRHGFTEATKPTSVAKGVHEPVLLSSSFAFGVPFRAKRCK